MKFELLHNRTIPMTYVLLTLQQAAERGVGRERLLARLGIPPTLLDQPDARLSLLQYTQIIYRALELTGDPSLGYEFSLRSRLTAHGFYGYGVLSQRTPREALEFAIRFVQLSTPCYSLRLYTEGAQAVLDIAEAIPFGPLRQYGFDMFLVAIMRAAQQLDVASKPALELWFECPEPDYYARYQTQLGPARFAMPANQIRFPVDYLDAQIGTANPVTAQLAALHCERELSTLGLTGDLLARVRAALVNERGEYLNLTSVARQVCMSTRTLKRHLQERGESFQRLRDEARQRDALKLLENAALSVEKISERLGYGSSANFTRAFRKWTGSTPGAARTRTSKSMVSPG